MDASDSKPKTVATIDVQLVSAISARDWLHESVHDHLNCVLCGSPLVFEHKTDHVEQIVTESAACSGCRVRNRKSEHRLQ